MLIEHKCKCGRTFFASSKIKHPICPGGYGRDKCGPGK